MFVVRDKETSEWRSGEWLRVLKEERVVKFVKKKKEETICLKLHGPKKKCCMDQSESSVAFH